MLQLAHRTEPRAWGGQVYSDAMMAWLLFSLLLLLQTVCARHLPLCDIDGDTYGRWESLHGYENNPALQYEIAAKYIFGGPGEALNFSQIWLPHNCSVHRFTNGSFHSVLERMVRRNEIQPPYRIIVMADSAMRGILCGVMRILSGSEIYGPSENAICGSDDLPVMSVQKHLHALANVYFGRNLELTFMYIQSLEQRYTRWMLEGNMNKAPHVLVLSTGAWDFDDMARQHIGENATLECNRETEPLSQARVQPAVQNAMSECIGIAKRLKVRAIFKGNHYNNRFGVNCADDRLQAMLKDTGWEWWDNRRLSEDVWRTQNWDGFHYDRWRQHTVAEHVAHREAELAQGKEAPGMLEMQFAQSLLHRLFRDELQSILHERSAQTLHLQDEES
jgi:hypothetical protein